MDDVRFCGCVAISEIAALGNFFSRVKVHGFFSASFQPVYFLPSLLCILLLPPLIQAICTNVRHRTVRPR